MSGVKPVFRVCNDPCHCNAPFNVIASHPIPTLLKSDNNPDLPVVITLQRVISGGVSIIYFTMRIEQEISGITTPTVWINHDDLLHESYRPKYQTRFRVNLDGNFNPSYGYLSVSYDGYVTLALDGELHKENIKFGTIYGVYVNY